YRTVTGSEALQVHIGVVTLALEDDVHQHCICLPVLFTTPIHVHLRPIEIANSDSLIDTGRGLGGASVVPVPELRDHDVRARRGQRDVSHGGAGKEIQRCRLEIAVHDGLEGAGCSGCARRTCGTCRTGGTRRSLWTRMVPADGRLIAPAMGPGTI